MSSRRLASKALARLNDRRDLLAEGHVEGSQRIQHAGGGLVDIAGERLLVGDRDVIHGFLHPRRPIIERGESIVDESDMRPLDQESVILHRLLQPVIAAVANLLRIPILLRPALDAK